MKNPVLDAIVKDATRRLTATYGYCGVAMADDMALLNSDDKQGGEIRINITVKAE